MFAFSRYRFNLFYVSLVVVLLISTPCSSQQLVPDESISKIEKAEVKWLSQWPSPESKNQKKEVKEQIKDFIIGKKKQDLVRPVSMIETAPNTYWILDQESHNVFQVVNNLSSVPRFLEKKSELFSSLVGICKFRENEILFTDSYSNKLFVVNPDKKECKILNDSLKLSKLTGIAYSSVTKEIWAIETGEHRIVVLNEKGKVLRYIGKRGREKGEFNFPTHIWIDKTGKAYVVDAMNFRVQVFNKEGEVISVFGSNGDATGYLASPKGIATDSYGHIYLADALSQVIQVFDIYGNFLYRFGSQGQGEGQFWMPSGLYIDENDKIIVADSYNSRIQVFQLITGGAK